jgi:transcriptional regulator with XRE-family HTH domain
MEDFPVDRYLRAARGLADMSQRELALRAGVPHQMVAEVEHSPRLARVDDFGCLLQAAGLRLIVADTDRHEIAPESEQVAALTDRARRRFPAHLDVRAGSDGWWGDGWPMFDGKTPTHTFDRNRGWRDWRRERNEADLTSELRSNQLGDLHGVQRRALTQVVVADEQSQPAQPIDARILSQPTDEARVSPGGLQRSGDVA